MSQAVVVHTFNPSTWEAEAEAGEFLISRPAWSTEFQDSQGYKDKPFIKKKKNKKKNKKQKTKNKKNQNKQKQTNKKNKKTTKQNKTKTPTTTTTKTKTKIY
jgi:FKBP-type peptidyl-prolyl cis-trans isomerase